MRYAEFYLEQFVITSLLGLLRGLKRFAVFLIQLKVVQNVAYVSENTRVLSITLEHKIIKR